MNRRAGTGSFKEFSGQYYQEVKYSDRDYDLIAIEEAWEKYQTNVKLLSSIFAVADADDDNLEDTLADFAGNEAAASANVEQKLLKMTEELGIYKKEAQEFNRKKFKELIDENLAFHEWMEEYNRPSFSEHGARGELTEEDRAELIKLGNDAEHRPFANLSAITLVNLSDKDKEHGQPAN